MGPGDTLDIDPSLDNNSNGPIYVFMEVEYDSSIYELKVTGSWKNVEGNVYAYVEGDSMKAVPEDDDAVLTGTLKVIAEGKAFSNLTADDMEVKVHGHGILTSICRDGVGQAWEDYQNGGKQ